MIDHVVFSDIASNKITKRVGFSFGYLFFGPLYLIARLRFEGILLLILYYFLLPLPGIEEFCEFMKVSNWNEVLVNVLTSFLMFFRSGWDKLQPYICILFILLLHIYLSINVDNYLLKRVIKKKNLHPLTELDARKLIHYNIVGVNVKLYEDIISKDEFNKIVENNWKEKNMSYTMMINKEDIDKSKNNKGRKKKVYTTSTTDLSIQYVKKDKTLDNQEIKQLHERNVLLYKEKKITKEEFEILEDRLKKK